MTYIISRAEDIDGSESSPESRLWAAVIHRMLCDVFTLCSARKTHGSRYEKVAKQFQGFDRLCDLHKTTDGYIRTLGTASDAISWFEGESSDFRGVCSMAGFDPAWISGQYRILKETRSIPSSTEVNREIRRVTHTIYGKAPKIDSKTLSAF